jgi:hypothetical protein
MRPDEALDLAINTPPGDLRDLYVALRREHIREAPFGPAFEHILRRVDLPLQDWDGGTVADVHRHILLEHPFIFAWLMTNARGLGFGWRMLLVQHLMYPAVELWGEQSFRQRYERLMPVFQARGVPQPTMPPSTRSDRAWLVKNVKGHVTLGMILGTSPCSTRVDFEMDELSMKAGRSYDLLEYTAALSGFAREVRQKWEARKRAGKSIHILFHLLNEWFGPVDP